MHSTHGCSSVSRRHRETSEALAAALFLPSASLGMVLAYAGTYVHTCRVSGTLTHAWVMPSPTCVELFVVRYRQAVISVLYVRQCLSYTVASLF